MLSKELIHEVLVNGEWTDLDINRLQKEIDFENYVMNIMLNDEE